jgi:hypothetical protein
MRGLFVTARYEYHFPASFLKKTGLQANVGKNWIGITSIHIPSNSLVTNKFTTGCYVDEVSDVKHQFIIFIMAYRVELVTSAFVKEQSLSLRCHVISLIR